MKPHRIRMVHDLVLNYNIFDRLEVLVSIIFFLRKEKKKKSSSNKIKNNCIPLFELTSLCIKRPPRATEEEMTRFHSDDYINFLKIVSPNSEDHYRQVQRCETTKKLFYPQKKFI